MEALAGAGLCPGRLPSLKSQQPSCISSSSASCCSSHRVACVPQSCYHTLLSNSSSKPYTPGGRKSSSRSSRRIHAAQKVAQEETEQVESGGIGQKFDVVSDVEAEVHHLYRAPFLAENAAEAFLKQVRARISSDITSIETEQCYNIALRAPLSAEKVEVLKWLLRETYEPQQLQSSSFLEVNRGIEGNASSTLVEVGPRLSFTTAWSANAISIFRECALPEVSRIERS